MRYIKILALHFESVFQHRARSFVWFLIALFNPLFMILLWNGAANKKMIAQGWNFTDLAMYYLFLIVAGSLLVAHIEEDVAEYDIREGRLVKYLLKPISYYWSKFFDELPFRVLQGFYGFLVLLAIFIFFGATKNIILHPEQLIFITGIIILGYFISFTFKMCIGLLAFWFTDIYGIYELIQITLITLGGFVMPITLFPGWLKSIAYFLPFSYMVYFPVTAAQGKYALNDLFFILLNQIAWLLICIVLYKELWKNGIKEFTSVGQ